MNTDEEWAAYVRRLYPDKCLLRACYNKRAPEYCADHLRAALLPADETVRCPCAETAKGTATKKIGDGRWLCPNCGGKITAFEIARAEVAAG